MPRAIGNRKVCSKCGIEKDVSEFYKAVDRPDGFMYQCKKCKNSYHKQYKKNNPQKIKEINKKLYKKYKGKYSKNKVLYAKKRRHTNKSYNILCNLRRRISLIMSDKYKSAPTMELIGCSLDFLKDHLQSTAIKNGYLNFNINNYDGGEFHIDHIIPCASWNLSCSYHQKLCFHWSNLQILSAEENGLKNNKLDYVVDVQENIRKSRIINIPVEETLIT